MGQTRTVRTRDYIEACGFQFLKDDLGWALYDGDTRAEVKNTRTGQYGATIRAAAIELGVADEVE